VSTAQELAGSLLEGEKKGGKKKGDEEGKVVFILVKWH
jgi:hypothetical protein